MKKAAIITLALLVGAISGSAKSPKRGVSENQFSMKVQMDPLTPGVSWYYNWSNVPVTGYPAGAIYDQDDIEFVPMCWNANYDADKIRAYVALHPEVKYILGFNEPNFTAQSNMSPQTAAENWPAVQALARELNLEIVAPALNYSPNAPYQDPTTWMDEFVTLVGKDAFDYVAVHNYGGQNVMKSLCGQFYEKYGKPVWVTEFCLWPGGSGNVYVSPEGQIASMIETVEWLETTDYIYRYAWFKAVGAHDASNKPNYGLIITESGEGERHLSPQGYAYVYMSEFDRERWYAPGENVAAKDYVKSCYLLIGQSCDTEPDAAPVEITRFNSGAYADYQFQVPEAGNYTLALRVSGVGAPTRFDPTLLVESVAEDGTTSALRGAEKFTLPGDDNTYATISLDNLSLPSGHNVLRLREDGLPSGIHISSLRLVKAAGIDGWQVDCEGLVNVYSVDGRLVREHVEKGTALEGLDKGLYVVGGKKVKK